MWTNFELLPLRDATSALVARVRQIEMAAWYLSGGGGGNVYFSSSGPTSGHSRVCSLDPTTRAWSEVAGEPSRDLIFPAATTTGIVALADRAGNQKFELLGRADERVKRMVPKRSLFSVRGGAALLLVYGGAHLSDRISARFSPGRPARPQRAALLIERDGTWSAAADIALDGAYSGHAEAYGQVLIATTMGLAVLSEDGAVRLEHSPRGDMFFPCIDGERLFFARLDGSTRQVHVASMKRDGDAIVVGEPREHLRSEYDKTHLHTFSGQLFFVENRQHEHVVRRQSLATGVIAEVATGGYIHDCVVVDHSRLAASFSGPRSSEQSIVIVDVDTQEIDDVLAADAGLSLGKQALVETPHGACWRFEKAEVRRGLVMHLHAAAPNETLPRWTPQLQLFIDAGYTVLAPNYSEAQGNDPDVFAPVRIVAEWLKWARAEFPGEPLFLHGLSKGAAVAEILVMQAQEKLAGVILEAPFGAWSMGCVPASPVLYLVGENDHASKWEDRRGELERLREHPGFFFRAYANEGHHLSERENLVDALEAIDTFMQLADRR